MFIKHNKTIHKKHTRRNHLIDVCTFVHKTKFFSWTKRDLELSCFRWWHFEYLISDVHFIWCMIDDSSICFDVDVVDVSAMIFLVWTMKLLFYDTNIVDWSVISSLHFTKKKLQWMKWNGYLYKINWLIMNWFVYL